MWKQNRCKQLGNHSRRTWHKPTGTNHGRPDFQFDRTNSYFKEANRERYVRKTILLDLELGTLDSIHIFSKEQACRLDNSISDQAGDGNNWAKDQCFVGAELKDSTFLDAHKEAEGCDFAQGLQITLFMGDWPDQIVEFVLFTKSAKSSNSKTIAAFISPKVSDTVVEPYNATFTFHLLVNIIDKVRVITN